MNRLLPGCLILLAISFVLLFLIPAIPVSAESPGTGDDLLPVDYGTLAPQLVLFGVVALIVFLLLFSAIVLGVKYVTDKTIHTVAASSVQYSKMSFITPMKKMGSFADQLPYLLINPLFWALEFLLVFVFLIFIWTTSIAILPADIGSLTFVIGGLCAFIIPSIYVMIVWLSDVYEREPFRFIFAMVLWGGSIAIFLALLINMTGFYFLAVLFGGAAASSLGAVLIAPVVEETLKGTGVLIISRHREMDGIFDGIVYGFCIGLGFSMMENWLYFSNNNIPELVTGGLGSWLEVILTRSIISFSHGCDTAITGAMIGFMKVKVTNHVRSYQNYDQISKMTFNGFLYGLPIAIFSHMIFNFSDSFGIKCGVPLLEVSVFALLGIFLQLQISRDRQNKKLGSYYLLVGNQRIAIHYGTVIKDYHIYGLQPGLINKSFTEVIRHPNDPNILGLKNLSATTWSVNDTSGYVKTVQPGQTVKITDGMAVQAGSATFSVYQ